MKKLSLFILSLLFAAMPVRVSAEGEGTADITNETIQILFTQELQSSVNGMKTEVITETKKEDGSIERNSSIVTFGGYAHLKTAIDTYRNENTLILDGGDFSHGSVYDSLYTKDAPDLSLLTMIGYDAVAVGENELEYGNIAFASMLEAAGETPEMLGNPDFSDDPETAAVFAAHNGKICTAFERGGMKIGVFALADDSLMKTADTLQTAKDAVSSLYDCALVICMYHTDDTAKIEKLLSKVDGIDLLIAGHDIRKSDEVTYIGKTAVVSAGEGGRYLGRIEVQPASDSIVSYEVIELDRNTFPADESFNAVISGYTANVQANMYNRYGFTAGQTVASSQTTFGDIRQTGSLSNSRMAELIADAMASAYEREDGEAHPVISILTREMVTGQIFRGNVTVEDLYEASGYGIDSYGIVGEPLVKVYLTGADLIALCEIDRSLLADDLPHQMYFGNMYYMYSDRRSELNKVEDVYVASTPKYYTPAEKNKLYPVVTTEAILDRIKKLAAGTGGDLYFTARAQGGYAISDYSGYRLTDSNGALKKTWTVLADHLKNMERNSSGMPEIESNYANDKYSRKTDTSFDMIRYFKNTSKRGLYHYGRIAAFTVGAIVILRLLIFLLNLKPRKEKE